MLILFSTCNLEEATGHLLQMTWTILLLVVAVLLSLVIVGIVQGIFVYHMIKGVKSKLHVNANITAHKGPQIQIKCYTCTQLVRMCSTVYSVMMPNCADVYIYVYMHACVCCYICKSMHLCRTCIYTYETCMNVIYVQEHA